MEVIVTLVWLVNTPLLDISSTEIRQAIALGHYRGKGLPRAVWQERMRQNTVAIFLIFFRASIIDESFLAICILYFV